MTTVLITGSRDWYCADVAAKVIERLVSKYDDGLLIRHGDCSTGVDLAFDEAARNAHLDVDPMPARWDDLEAPGAVIRTRLDGTKYNANAGPLRNSEMVAKGADFCLAFSENLPGSRGTLDCMRKALAAGIPVWFWSPTSDHFIRVVSGREYKFRRGAVKF